MDLPPAGRAGAGRDFANIPASRTNFAILSTLTDDPWRARLGQTTRGDPMIDMRVKWPNNARVAVMLTFDFDAETLWLGRDPENARRPGVLSQGTYGAKVGVPMILQTLREEGVKATFFVVGWTAETHQDRAEMILREGHEIAHHSYSHTWIDPAFPDKEVEEMEKGLEALKTRLGVVPKGYRSPPARPATTSSGC